MINEEIISRKITPKNDIIFKKIFGSKGNEGILKDFLEGILETKIESVTLGLETEMLPEFYIGKNSRLDVRTELADGTFVNVEIQTNTDNYSDKRDLVYWSKLYLKALEKGDDYRETRKTICIWIVDGMVYDFEKYHSKWEITETDIGKTMYFKDFEIHVIELQKFRKLAIMKPAKKEFWLWFIDHTRKELVEMACYSNEQVDEARKQLEKITSNGELMTLIIADQMDEMDRKVMMKRVKEAEENIKEAEKKVKAAEEKTKAAEEKTKAAEEKTKAAEEKTKAAEEKTKAAEEKTKAAEEKTKAAEEKTKAAEEKTKAAEEKLKETAKKMLEKNIEIELIMELTGLSKEEIEKIK